MLAFPPPETAFEDLGRFAAKTGLVLGALPLIFVRPGAAELYYVKLQNLPAADIPLVRIAAVSLIAFPLTVAMRARNEGLAAHLKKPSAVLIGNSMFMTTILVTGGAASVLGVPGYFIGALGLSIGNLVSTIVIRLGLKRSRRQPVLPGQTTTTSVGHIR